MTVRVLAATAALTAALCATVATVPAGAATASYVALGDSYSAGTGTRSAIDDGTSCQRSVHAYPWLLAAERGLALNFRACSGATVADVATTQLGALGATTAHVSLSVGGNDAGFAGVLTECALPAWMSDCHGAIDDAQRVINDVLPGRLSALYASIRAKAPRARVTVVGYPRLFNGQDCNAGTWFSPTEMSRLNSTADLLNSRTSAQAAGRGFAFADPTSSFTGHAVCDGTAWLNGLSSPLSASYHPNRSGHVGYAGVVAPTLVGTVLRVGTTATVIPSPAEVRAQVRLQRRYAALDATITPARFRAPDLAGARARTAAAAAGVDLSSRASVDAADRTHAARQARGPDARG